ncbi:TonB-dependent receptor domain-containing protein [Jeongeupia sp. USM3]|uniref:TonB-dependent receptor domain-containing protein n=1 Tax=Jeongeupia sp. USM3 TaxID=1906741 RepID=UPI00089DDC70|nr:TonB-dependent receptor [Jeongeupia sp. USM3]AOY02418.1 TonB-dependent receptor [Jeongeupia sp. USM3]
MIPPFKSSPMLAVVSALFAAAPAMAAETETQLESVVVTAAGYEQKIKEAPASISVITREQLESQPFTSLSDAVRHVEGVSVVGPDPNETDISIRGMPGEYTLILVDGKRQNTRETMNRGTGGVQPYQIPPMEAIERIEVVRGPMSSLYGSDAMGGVINIITRKVPKAWKGSVTAGGVLQEDSNYGNTGEGSFWLGGPLKDDLLGLQVYGSYSNRGEDDIYYPNSMTSGANGTRNQNYGAKLTLAPSKDQEFILEAGRNELTYTDTPGESIAANAPSAKNEHDRTNWALTHNGRWGWGATTVALYQEIARQITTTGGVESASKPEITNTVLDGLVTLPFDTNILKLGAQYNHNKLESISRESVVAGHAVSPDSVTNRVWALFAEDEYFVTEKLSLTGGLRLDNDERYGSHWTPRLYAVYKVTDTITVRGGAASGFKAPTLRQTTAGYCMTSGGGTQKRGSLCGNPDLEPETSVTEEIGIRYDAPNGTNASLTLFNNDFKNKVVSYDTGVPDPFNRALTIYKYDNIDKVNIRGAELGGAMPFAKDWKVSANYTYTKSEREGGGEPAFDGGSLDGRPLDKTPEHMANLRLDWTPIEKLATFARVTYTGKQYWAAFRNGAMNVREADAYATADLGASYTFNKHLTANFTVLNITDEIEPVDDRTRTGGLDGNWMVQEGRRYWLSVTASF